jgi:hypothetical protein
MPQQGFAFRFSEEMDLGLREALFQQMEHGRGKQSVAQLALLTDEDAPGFEGGKVYHRVSLGRSVQG